MDTASEDPHPRVMVPRRSGPQPQEVEEEEDKSCAESLSQSLLRFFRPYFGSFSIAGAMLPPQCSTSPPSSARTSTSSTQQGHEGTDGSSTWFQRVKRRLRYFQLKTKKSEVGTVGETEQLLLNSPDAAGHAPRSSDAKSANTAGGGQHQRLVDERAEGEGEPTMEEDRILHTNQYSGAEASPLPAQSASVRSIRTTSTASHFGRTRSGNRLPSYRSHRSIAAESTASTRGLGGPKAPRTKSGYPWSFLDHATKLPPKVDEDRLKLTVVLDLDETIVFARDGPVYVRPHAVTLLGYLREHCEVIVWTSGTKAHAKNVLRVLDPQGLSVKYCIYFNPPKLSQGDFSPAIQSTDSLSYSVYDKDLRLLGRPLNWTILIDNTAECCTSTPENAIIVADYRGPPIPGRNGSAVGNFGEQNPLAAETAPHGKQVLGEAEEDDDDVTLLVVTDILKGVVEKRRSSGVDDHEGKGKGRRPGQGGQEISEGGWGSKAIPLGRPLKWSNRTIDSEEEFNGPPLDAHMGFHSPAYGNEVGVGAVQRSGQHAAPAWEVKSYLRQCPFLLRWDVLPADSLLPVTMNFLCTDRWEGDVPIVTQLAAGSRPSQVDTPVPVMSSLSKRKLKGPGGGSGTTSGWMESFRSSTNRSSISFRSDGASTMPPSPQVRRGEGDGFAENTSAIPSDRRVDSSSILRLQSRAELMASDSLLRQERRKRTKS
jgi:hypothetical protein